MKKILFFLMMVLMIFLVGCSQSGEKQVFAPEDVNEGVDRCDVCNMLVPNDYNATQILLNDGRSLKFDDIGCMAIWEDENGLTDVNARYVRDYHTEEWIFIEEATFAYDMSFRTPMAYGIYAFKNKQDAEKFVEDEGKGIVLSYEELQEHHWERNMEMMEMMKEEMGHHHDHGEEHMEEGHH